jgi:hypothetical protein
MAENRLGAWPEARYNQIYPSDGNRYFGIEFWYDAWLTGV